MFEENEKEISSNVKSIAVFFLSKKIKIFIASFFAIFIILILIVGLISESLKEAKTEAVNSSEDIYIVDVNDLLAENDSEIVDVEPNGKPVERTDICISSTFSDIRVYNGQTFLHGAIDLAPTGSGDYNIRATHDGVAVLYNLGAGSCVVGGNTITYGVVPVIEVHNKNFSTRYLHMKKILVGNGEKIKKGQVIGLMGNVGCSTGKHLDYRINKKNEDGSATIVDPEDYVNYNDC